MDIVLCYLREQRLRSTQLTMIFRYGQRSFSFLWILDIVIGVPRVLTDRREFDNADERPWWNFERIGCCIICDENNTTKQQQKHSNITRPCCGDRNRAKKMSVFFPAAEQRSGGGLFTRVAKYSPCDLRHDEHKHMNRNIN